MTRMTALYGKTAILVDGDNVHPNQVRDLESKYVKFFPYTTHREVVMNDTLPSKFHKYPEMYRVTCVRSNKNAADLELTVRGMELANTVDWVILCSADNDFIPMIRGIKRLGCRVAICSTKCVTSPHFIETADLYINLDAKQTANVMNDTAVVKYMKKPNDTWVYS